MMLRFAAIPSRTNKTASTAMAVCLAAASLMGSAAFDSPAIAQTNATAVSADTLATSKARVADALAAGKRVLLVELYGTTLYVFNANHTVGGPVVRVLETLGFTSVLPEGISVGGSGATSVPMEQLQRASADHVFFLNFSTEEAQVRDIENALRQISKGSLHRLDTTTSVALSPDWTEAYLIPRMADAIQPAG